MRRRRCRILLSPAPPDRPTRLRRRSPDGGFDAASADTAAEAEASPLTAEDSVLGAVTLPRFGDFDSMLTRRIVRVLVSPSQTQYFLDQGTPRGLTVDAAALFEAELNRKYRTGSRPIRVILIPVQHDELLPALLAGRGDIVASGHHRHAGADRRRRTFPTRSSGTSPRSS